MESLIEYFAQNHDKLLYLLAGLSLVLEMTVLGLSGPMLFFSIACGITGMMASFGLVSSWEYEVLSVGVLSVVSAVVLWKPLKGLQGVGRVSDGSSDMIGQIVPVSEDVTAHGGSIRHSGINWQARLHSSVEVETIKSGLRVEICAVDGNVMIVKEMS